MNHIQIAEEFQTQSNLLPMRPGHIGKHGGKPNKGISELAKKNGCSRRYVSDHLALLVAPELHKDIASGKFPYTYIRAYLVTPLSWRKGIVGKFHAREFQNREAAMALASVLKHYPEKGTELLAINYKQLRTTTKVKTALAKVVNPPLDTRAVQEVVEKFMCAKKTLQDFMITNHPDGAFSLMPSINTPLELSNLHKEILAWGKSSSAKSLPKLILKTTKEAERQRQLPFKTGH